MNCPNCNGTISQHDRFCRHCGKPVVAPPPPTLALRPHREGIRFPIELNDFGPAEILAAHSGETWGAHIYTGHSAEPGEIKAPPEGCPEWVANSDWRCWFRRGLTVWDLAAQRIGSLLANEALELLKSLEMSDDWKINGIPIVERHKNEFSLGEEVHPKRSRKKKNVGPESPPEEPQPAPKFYEQERVRLYGDSAAEFSSYLHDNETLLQQMADQEAALQQKADEYLFPIQMMLIHDVELNKFDWTTRACPWECQKHPTKLVCNMPPDRGTITLSEDNTWWLPVIERPGHAKDDYHRFLLLEQAVTWVEQTIPELRAQEEERNKKREREEAEEEAQIAALPRMDLTPYQINPADLEPERITYRAVIEVEYLHYSAKSREISFGEKQYYDEEYYTPTMLADQLKLNPAQVEVKRPYDFMGWYFIRSAVTYLQEAVAATAAQRLWDQSSILDKFREQKLIRARYGYEEVETSYRTWLGECQNQDKLWTKPASRAEHIAHQAMRETLLHALDVNGWRAFMEIPFQYRTDDELLQAMHKARVKSRYQSAEVRAESAQWLADHGTADT